MMYAGSDWFNGNVNVCHGKSTRWRAHVGRRIKKRADAQEWTSILLLSTNKKLAMTSEPAELPRDGYNH